jgi:hypothetical protein
LSWTNFSVCLATLVKIMAIVLDPGEQSLFVCCALSPSATV